MVMLTRREAAARVKLHVRTLDCRIADGTGPAITKLGKRVLISEAALEAWIAAQTVQPVGNA